jgi:hypothetical protein
VLAGGGLPAGLGAAGEEDFLQAQGRVKRQRMTAPAAILFMALSRDQMNPSSEPRSNASTYGQYCALMQASPTTVAAAARWAGRTPHDVLARTMAPVADTARAFKAALDMNAST